MGDSKIEAKTPCCWVGTLKGDHTARTKIASMMCSFCESVSHLLLPYKGEKGGRQYLCTATDEMLRDLLQQHEASKVLPSRRTRRAPRTFLPGRGAGGLWTPRAPPKPRGPGASKQKALLAQVKRLQADNKRKGELVAATVADIEHVEARLRVAEQKTAEIYGKIETAKAGEGRAWRACRDKENQLGRLATQNQKSDTRLARHASSAEASKERARVGGTVEKEAVEEMGAEIFALREKLAEMERCLAEEEGLRAGAEAIASKASKDLGDCRARLEAHETGAQLHKQ